MCGREMMVDIECRTADSKVPHKETGENVDCSLQGGLECRPSHAGTKKAGGVSSCSDYEIRIRCHCGNFLFCFASQFCPDKSQINPAGIVESR